MFFVTIVAVLCIVAALIVSAQVAGRYKLGFGGWMFLWLVLSIAPVLSIVLSVIGTDLWSTLLAIGLVVASIAVMAGLMLKIVHSWPQPRKTEFKPIK